MPRKNELRPALLDTIFNTSPVAMLLLSNDFEVVRANAAAEQMLNAVRLDDLIPKPSAQTPFQAEVRVGKHTLDVRGEWSAESDAWLVWLNDITAQRELEHTREVLARMMSHDLKNPLSRMLGFSDLLLESEGLTEKQRSQVERVVKSGEEMIRMMSDYHALEQLRAAEPKREPVDLLALLQKVQKQVTKDVTAKRLTLTADLPASFPAIMGDAAQLLQMLSQLVGNAVRFTPEEGSIWLRLRQVDSQAQIEIGDTGYGIPLETQDRLFQEFYRVRTADTAGLTGSGLGLSLVKSVVDAHGGRIDVNSAEGEGSSFTVVLPIA